MSGLRLFGFRSMVIPTDNRKGLCNVFKKFCVVLDTTRGILKSFLKKLQSLRRPNFVTKSKRRIEDSKRKEPPRE